MQAARWTRLSPDLGYIYSFNGPHSLFADTIRSLRALAVAHQLGHVLMGEGDRPISLLGRLLQHAEATARFNVYFGKGRDAYDVRGRVAHESIFNLNDGAYRCPSSQQGYSPFTTWTRGLAWILCGYAEELEFLATPARRRRSGDSGRQERRALARFREVAEATADFYIAEHARRRRALLGHGRARPREAGRLPRIARPSRSTTTSPWTARPPPSPRRGCCASGNCWRRAATRERGRRYRQAGLTVARTLFAEPYLSTDPAPRGPAAALGLPPPERLGPRAARAARCPAASPRMWGDYHARELALLVLREAEGIPYPRFFLS